MCPEATPRCKQDPLGYLRALRPSGGHLGKPGGRYVKIFDTGKTQLWTKQAWLKWKPNRKYSLLSVRGTILSNPVPTSISKQATCTALLQKHCGNALRRLSDGRAQGFRDA